MQRGGRLHILDLIAKQLLRLLTQLFIIVLCYFWFDVSASGLKLGTTKSTQRGLDLTQ
jgi:hypothetical protein